MELLTNIDHRPIRSSILKVQCSDCSTVSILRVIMYLVIVSMIKVSIIMMEEMDAFNE